MLSGTVQVGMQPVRNDSSDLQARGRLAARHIPSGLNTDFCCAGMDFDGYLAASLKMLRQVHGTKPEALRERMVLGNAPFALSPAPDAERVADGRWRRGILLVHGLTDSAYAMRPLAEFFRQQGFRVMTLLLPGHGTQPGDLLEVRWQAWAEAVAWGTEQLARDVSEVYLGGYSAGGALAVRHSLLDARVRGLFLFSPAFKVSFLAAWANVHKLYSWLAPTARWVGIKPDDDPYKYESFAKNAAAQMHGLIQDLRRLQGVRDVNIPVFAAASADDATVDSRATLAFMARARHPQNRLVFYTTEQALLPPGLAESQVQQVSSVVPGQNIFSFSHVALLMPPEDPHYGRNGAYSNCLHYFPGDMKCYAACRQNGPELRQGEASAEALRGGLMRRLTYNPHFCALESSMRQFIESLP